MHHQNEKGNNTNIKIAYRTSPLPSPLPSRFNIGGCSCDMTTVDKHEANKKRRPRPAWTTTLKTGGRGGVSLLGDRSEMLEWQNIDTTFQNKNTCEVVQSFVLQQSPKPRCCIPPETHSSTITHICARFFLPPMHNLVLPCLRLKPQLGS